MREAFDQFVTDHPVTDNDDFHDRAFLNVLGWIRHRVADGESDSEK
ncbi:hypothetical protein J2794_006479 [Paraburkholderia terricola]|nr:hypothetical protein [Paraburkholderia terricola]